MTNMQGRRRRSARVWSPQGVPTKRITPPPSPASPVSIGSPASPVHTEKFAGSKWGEAPAPAALPRPPVHWTSRGSDMERFDRSVALKMLLQVA